MTATAIVVALLAFRALILWDDRSAYTRYGRWRNLRCALGSHEWTGRVRGVPGCAWCGLAPGGVTVPRRRRDGWGAAYVRTNCGTEWRA